MAAADLGCGSMAEGIPSRAADVQHDGAHQLERVKSRVSAG